MADRIGQTGEGRQRQEVKETRRQETGDKEKGDKKTGNRETGEGRRETEEEGQEMGNRGW